MAVTVKFTPGYRLFDGSDLNKMVEQINESAEAAPTATVRGGVLEQTAIPNISDAPSESDFNGLLAALRAAGLLASS